MLTRRALLYAGTALGSALGTLGLGRAAHSAAVSASIEQPKTPSARSFVGRAFDMKRLAEKTGDQSFGAVVVRDGRIVGQAPSRVVVNRDPTAHAEMEAIRDAARRQETRHLSGAVLYSSSHPCPMCEAAAYWAGIDRMVYGSAATDGGAPMLGRC
ncbi:MAG: nucleoside deaminase [Rhodospirillales bacterium]|nr:nucleoside deaminase [Rhodospirillales bacterium]